MITAVAKRELLLQARDGRLVLIGVLLVALVGAAAAMGWRQHARGEAERALFAAQSYEQWLDQGPKHPHRAASFGIYVAKPELPLAIFEPGLRPQAGRTLWLEAHAQAAFSNAPADDDATLSAGLGERSGAALLQVLGGLLALVLGALSVAREREGGVLRQVLAQGASPGRWLAGKYLGLVGALAIPLAPLGLGVGAALVVAAAPAERADVALRTLAAAGANALYLLALLALGVAASVLARSARGALVAVLAFWIAISFVAPRAASTLAMAVAPTPDAAAYDDAVGAEFASGYGDEPGWSERLERLETETLARYRVASLDELPVGFSGLRMLAMEAWTNEVSDRHFARLQATYAAQERVRLGVAALAPFVAARSVSHGMAGMDWAHYRHFADAAERYRRGFNTRMNALIVRGTRGQAWDMAVGREAYAAVPPFSYRIPGVGWALGQQAVALAVLGGWAVAGALLLALAARRLRP